MKINFQSQQIQNQNFTGLYERVGHVATKYNGKYHLVDHFIYHPFENETTAEIKYAIDKYNKGRSFTLVSTEKYQWKDLGDYIMMNFVKLGDTLKENCKYNNRYTKEPVGGIQTHDEFMKTYNTKYLKTINLEEASSKDLMAKLVGHVK